MILVVTETRVYEVPEEDGERLKMLALMGPVEAIPNSVARSASLFSDDEEVGPF